MNPLALLAELVAVPGPPGDEARVREVVARHVAALGYSHTTDVKGNLLVSREEPVRVLVTAHLDEIGMLVRRIEPDGRLVVTSLGGLYPWKLGEGPVQILCRPEPLDGVLGFGSIHTHDPGSVVRRADAGPVTWDMARVLTGRSPDELRDAGVRPGTRVAVHPSRRGLTRLGELVAGHFLDDRADLVSWLLALSELSELPPGVAFAATTSEEIGGEGALVLMDRLRPDVCVALELGPQVDDAPVELTDQPTVWANDRFSPMSADDGELVSSVGQSLGLELQFQAMSGGGSDASCAASHGLCARAITLGLPMANSHGYEVMHAGAMESLARLTVELVRRLAHP